MRVVVSVRPKARIEKGEKISDGEYRVWVKAPDREGKADEALLVNLFTNFSLKAIIFLELERAHTAIKQLTRWFSWSPLQFV